MREKTELNNETPTQPKDGLNPITKHFFLFFFIRAQKKKKKLIFF